MPDQATGSPVPAAVVADDGGRLFPRQPESALQLAAVDVRAQPGAGGKVDQPGQFFQDEVGFHPGAPYHGRRPIKQGELVHSVLGSIGAIGEPLRRRLFPFQQAPFDQVGDDVLHHVSAEPAATHDLADRRRYDGSSPSVIRERHAVGDHDEMCGREALVVDH